MEEDYYNENFNVERAKFRLGIIMLILIVCSTVVFSFGIFLFIYSLFN